MPSYSEELEIQRKNLWTMKVNSSVKLNKYPKYDAYLKEPEIYDKSLDHEI